MKGGPFLRERVRVRGLPQERPRCQYNALAYIVKNASPRGPMPLVTLRS
jgi:hypothetical protein